jgi:hypothetical protein
MKLKFITIWITLLFNNVISAQIGDTIYFDKKFVETSSSDYAYFRLSAKYGDIIKVTDYFSDGKIQMTGGFKSLDFIEPTGPFFYYNKKGRITELEVYEPKMYPGILSDFIKLGISIPDDNDSLMIDGYYHKNGKIHGMGFAKDPCTAHGTWLYFNKHGNIYCQINFLNSKRNGKYILYDNFGIPFLEGYYKDGERDGPWEYFSYHSTQIRKTKFYKNGEKIKTVR